MPTAARDFARPGAESFETILARVDRVQERLAVRDDTVLCVSGRLGYEIVQKAVVAGVPVIAAVSAPSSLAVDLAERFRVTLCGFVRGGAFTIYSHPQRIAP